MSARVADTHAVILYYFSSPRLSANARVSIDVAIQAGDPIFVARISLVEVVYLIEKGRLPTLTLERLAKELSDAASRFRTVRPRSARRRDPTLDPEDVDP